jgi:hypothetical protein
MRNRDAFIEETRDLIAATLQDAPSHLHTSIIEVRVACHCNKPTPPPLLYVSTVRFPNCFSAVLIQSPLPSSMHPIGHVPQEALYEALSALYNESCHHEMSVAHKVTFEAAYMCVERDGEPLKEWLIDGVNTTNNDE